MQSKNVNYFNIILHQSNLFCKSSFQNIDKSTDFVSLDDIYYFGGQSSHNQIAILPHKAKSKDEINLNIGDEIGMTILLPLVYYGDFCFNFLLYFFRNCWKPLEWV